jgi:hypothetical protein
MSSSPQIILLETFGAGDGLAFWVPKFKSTSPAGTMLACRVPGPTVTADGTTVNVYDVTRKTG